MIWKMGNGKVKACGGFLESSNTFWVTFGAWKAVNFALFAFKIKVSIIL